METLPTLFAAAAVKAALILAVAGLVTVAWRSASASARHLVWAIAVASALMIPLAGIGVSLLDGPRIPVAMWNPVVTISADVAPEESELKPLASIDVPATQDVAIPAASEPAIAAPLDVEPTYTEKTAAPSPVTARMSLSTFLGLIAPSFGGGILSSWKRVVVTLWFAGAIIALLPLLVALTKVRIVSHRSRTARDGRWLRLIQTTPAIRHMAGRVRI